MDGLVLIATLMAGLAVAMIGAVLVLSLPSPTRSLRRRAHSVGRMAEARADHSEIQARQRRKLIQDKLVELEGQRSRQRRTRSIRALIRQAGIDLSLRSYILSSVALGGLVCVTVMVTGLAAGVGLIAGLGTGLTLPRWGLMVLAKRRQTRFIDQFPEALDVLVRGTRSGLPVAECLAIVAEEFQDPLGGEFRRIVENQRLGMTIDQALEKAIERMTVTEFRYFAVVLELQRRTGGNLATTVENLTDVLRARRRLGERVEAYSAQAKASAIIVGGLPFFVTIMVSVVNPGYLMPMFEETVGNFLLAVCLAWMGVGALIMRGMINFKV